MTTNYLYSTFKIIVDNLSINDFNDFLEQIASKLNRIHHTETEVLNMPTTAELKLMYDKMRSHSYQYILEEKLNELIVFVKTQY